MDIPRIVVGLELVDDDGDEVVVQKINEAKGTVLLETSEGDKYSMAIRELRTKLKDGEFARIVDGTNEDDDFDDPQEEDEEDEAA